MGPPTILFLETVKTPIEYAGEPIQIVLVKQSWYTPYIPFIIECIGGLLFASLLLSFIYKFYQDYKKRILESNKKWYER